MLRMKRMSKDMGSIVVNAAASRRGMKRWLYTTCIQPPKPFLHRLSPSSKEDANIHDNIYDLTMEL